jgi:hypothetical protein
LNWSQTLLQVLMVQHAPVLPQQHVPLQLQLASAMRTNAAAGKQLLSMAPQWQHAAAGQCQQRRQLHRWMGTLVVKVWKLGTGLRQGWRGRRKTHGSSATLRSITDFQHLPWTCKVWLVGG